ncbi:hypothetical protein GlitD10_2543 [Gloeomargarita lithophora Alchichica-D10]|uniref:Bacterial Pleckstrin homology domain-containing protein n=2 Tax=Gloeomargarita TaxID=1188227 RepID=A0A1J0AG18_9CYAN|nr:hypothetical protein GlitD10_2543 [Gloeomargarita lithophora Alchichica-D10]
MSAGILTLTLVLGALPLVFVIAAFLLPKGGILLLVALFLLMIYGGIWWGWRPMALIIRDDDRLELRFPVRRRWLELHPERRVRQLSPAEFAQEMGWAVRVGAGGFGGGFGWLWTQRRGWVEFYISRGDGLVLLEQPGTLPLLVTPAQPERFVELLSVTKK